MEVGRLRHRFDDLEAPAVLQRWDTRARLRHFRQVDLGHHHPRLAAAFRQDTAPGIDDQRMSEGLAAVLVLAALCGGEHETAVLDGACSNQEMPMRFAGLLRE